MNGVEEGPLTKRKMLSIINGIFDLLGIAAFIVIVAKILYSEVCLRKLNWDEEVPENIFKPRAKWLNDICESSPQCCGCRPDQSDPAWICRCQQVSYFSSCIRSSNSHQCTSSAESACGKVKDSAKGTASLSYEFKHSIKILGVHFDYDELF